MGIGRKTKRKIVKLASAQPKRRKQKWHHTIYEKLEILEEELKQ